MNERCNELFNASCMLNTGRGHERIKNCINKQIQWKFKRQAIR